jgi:hypothetical protein
MDTGAGVVGIDGALVGVLAMGEDGGVEGFTVNSLFLINLSKKAVRFELQESVIRSC